MKQTPLLQVLIGCVLSITLTSAHAQEKKGLLWRISGNGLEKPSYLYGTLHLTDKRVFNFGDSVYAALESCAGYAMELNPDSLDAYYNNIFDNRPSPFIKDVVSEHSFVSAKKKLRQVFHKRPGKVTVKELREYFTRRANFVNDHEVMETFMDAYVFYVAKMKGKWVGAIEDMEDQLRLGNDGDENNVLGAAYNLKELVNGNEVRKLFFEAMVKVYNENDLDKIDAFFNTGADRFDKEMMNRRNRKMGMRMDSLARIRSTFFAVGCAHLPGEQGVINELRKRGYTVTAVMPTRFLSPRPLRLILTSLKSSSLLRG